MDRLPVGEGVGQGGDAAVGVDGEELFFGVRGVRWRCCLTREGGAGGGNERGCIVLGCIGSD